MISKIELLLGLQLRASQSFHIVNSGTDQLPNSKYLMDSMDSMDHKGGQEAAVGRSKRPVRITAVEDDYFTQDEPEDVIPGPPASHTAGHSSSKSRPDRSSGSNNSGGATTSSSRRKFLSLRGGKREEPTPDPLQISSTDHQWAGQGILASRADLELPPEVFAAGCNLLQAAAVGNARLVEETLNKNPKQVDFRDYDR